MSGFRCATCGQHHEGPPFSLGPNFPLQYERIPEEERRRIAEITSDQCILEGEHFFIRGRIEIPVHGSEQNFFWLVWVRVAQREFERMAEMWETPSREKEPSYPGRLANSLPFYPETLDLEVSLQTNPVGLRPSVRVVGDHALALEQRDGISLARVQQFAEQVLHPNA